MRDRLIELINEFKELDFCVPPDWWIEHFADHLLANGVIVPPCKVGQTMYVVSRYYKGTWEIYECKVDEITMYEKHTFIRMKSWENLVFAENTSEIGKCVFYTREEAEKALSERSET